MRCRFCGAERSDGSGPCAACGEPVPAAGAGRWWESNATVILALAVLGPLALPLVWAHRRYKWTTKLALTVMVVAFTIWSVLVARKILESLVARLSDSF